MAMGGKRQQPAHPTGSNGGPAGETPREADDEKKRMEQQRRHMQHPYLLVTVIASGLTGLLLARLYYHKGLWTSLKWGFWAAYLPSYLEPSFWTFGRTWPAFQRLSIWRSLNRYFRSRVVVLEPLDPGRQVIFGAHPHGLGTWNHFITMTDGRHFLSKVFPAPRRDLAATVLFFVPFLRELLMWLGCVDASAYTAHKILKAGYSTLIYVGGEQEQIMTTYGREIVYIKRRKGFIRLALKYGCEVVPMYTWGENDVYYTLDWKWFKDFQLWLASKTYFAAPPSWGRWLVPCIPQSRQLVLVTGKRLNKDQPPIPHPTHEQVEALHAQYVAELQRMFDETKQQYGGLRGKDAVLEIH